MTAKEFYNLVMSEAKEGKTDSQILEKLLKIEGFENAMEELAEIRKQLKE